MTTNNIRYLYNAETGIELIFCKNSTISYPLHNHVSVLTIGIILDGSVVLKADKEKSTEKIDGAVATIMELDRAIRCGNNICNIRIDFT